MSLPTLSHGEFELVYNMLSLAIAAMFGSFVFFVIARNQLTHNLIDYFLHIPPL